MLEGLRTAYQGLREHSRRAVKEWLWELAEEEGSDMAADYEDEPI